MVFGAAKEGEGTQSVKISYHGSTYIQLKVDRVAGRDFNAGRAEGQL